MQTEKVFSFFAFLLFSAKLIFLLKLFFQGKENFKNQILQVILLANNFVLA